MLLVSDKSGVAVRALAALAQLGGSDEPVAIADVARRAEVALPQVEQVFGQLRRGGMLRSQRGVGGGYLLTRAVADVTLLDVVEAVDGPLGDGTDSVFAGPRDALRGALTRRTLEEVVREAEQGSAPMYWI